MARAIAEAAWTEPSGVVLGTARYASPEQAQGKAVDGKSDVYSLALVLIESVTGKVPFSSDTTVSTLMSRIDALLPVPDSMGPLRSVVERAGRPDPLERYDAAELGRALVGTAERLPRPAPFPLVPQKPSTGDLLDLTTMKSAGSTMATAVGGTHANEPFDVERADVARVRMEDPKPHHRWRRRLLLLLTALVLLVGGGAAVYAATQASVPKHEVPAVTGMEEQQALAAVGEFGWKIDRQTEYDDASAAGVVLSQDPPPGEQLKEGGTFTLVVSLGPTPVGVPDLTGLSDGQAGEALAAQGLVVGTVTEVNDEVVPDALRHQLGAGRTGDPQGQSGEPRGVEGTRGARRTGSGRQLRQCGGCPCGRPAEGNPRRSSATPCPPARSSAPCRERARASSGTPSSPSRCRRGPIS